MTAVKVLASCAGEKLDMLGVDMEFEDECTIRND